jgi:hypothetical protein
MAKKTLGHHLILGELTDYLTGKILEDTHDERYKQKLARLLVEDKGYRKREIKPRHELIVTAGEKRARINIDFSITLADSIRMIIKYGPGSLVTRHRCALAASRLLSPYQIPVVVVTNGEEADVLDGWSGKVVSQGFESIPVKSELIQRTAKEKRHHITEKQAEMESRIVYAFEIDGRCPCDDTVCSL